MAPSLHAVRLKSISFNRALTVFAILGFSMVSDQITKKIAADTLRGHYPQAYWNNFFRLEYVENPGAFLSLGGSLSPELRFWFLNVAVAAFLLVLLYTILTSRAMTKLQVGCLALVLGGGVSNLMDRFFRHNGQVIDFLNMGIGNLRTGVFNVADMYIMFGIIVFTIANFRHDQAASASAKKF